MATAPRWKNAITKALSLPENKGQNLYQLATVDADVKPHARTLVHRDFLHPANSPHLPIVLTTTDVRTPKAKQIRANAHGELCWWMSGSKDQFRLYGTVRIVSSPHVQLDVGTLVQPSLALDTMDKQGFDWEKKRLEVFDNMSAHMKASWCRPPPGSRMESYEDAKKWPQTVPKIGEAESEEDKKNLEWALRNFALVLVEPVDVDWVQLGVQPNQRTRFVREGKVWSEDIIVP